MSESDLLSISELYRGGLIRSCGPSKSNKLSPHFASLGIPYSIVNCTGLGERIISEVKLPLFPFKKFFNKYKAIQIWHSLHQF